MCLPLLPSRMQSWSFCAVIQGVVLISFIWASTSRDWQTWCLSSLRCHGFYRPGLRQTLGPRGAVLAQCCSRPFCRPPWFGRAGPRSPLSPRVRRAGLHPPAFHKHSPSQEPPLCWPRSPANVKSPRPPSRGPAMTVALFPTTF